MEKLYIHKEKIILFLILLLAGALRLYRISDYMTFLGDEGRDVLVVYDILHGNPKLLGPTSSVGGFFLGPIYYYFMAPFLWLFNYDPVGPAVMVGLFGIATVWFVYKVGMEFFNQKAGLIAALLYAVSPLVIAYSRSSWNPNLMPFFTLLTLYTLYQGIRKKSYILFFVCGLLFGILMQLHYVATFVGAIIVIYLLTTSSIFQAIKRGVFIFVGFLVGLSPWVLFEFIHGFPNTRSIFTFVFHSQEVSASGNFLGTVQDVFFRLFGRLITMFPPPEQVSLQAHKNIAIWYGATLVLAIISCYAFIVLYKKSLKEKSNTFLKLHLLFIWFVVGVLIFGFYKKQIYDYYFGFMFPLPFLLVGNAGSYFIEKGKIFKTTAISTCIFLFVFNLSGMPFQYPANKQKDQVKEISEFVLSKTEGKPYNFALITLGNSDHGYRYFFKLAGKNPVVIENEEKDPKRKTVTGQLLVVCEDPNCHPLGNPVWEVAGFGRAEISDQWQVSVVQVYKLTHYKGKD